MTFTDVDHAKMALDAKIDWIWRKRSGADAATREMLRSWIREVIEARRAMDRLYFSDMMDALRDV